MGFLHLSSRQKERRQKVPDIDSQERVTGDLHFPVKPSQERNRALETELLSKAALSSAQDPMFAAVGALAIYVLLGALIAPAIVEAGVPEIPAHLFILYFGMMSMITPPIAIGAFAAATIAGGRRSISKCGWKDSPWIPNPGSARSDQLKKRRES